MENKKDLDGFWDIDDIVPKKKLNTSPRDTAACEISVGSPADSNAPPAYKKRKAVCVADLVRIL